MKGFAVLVLLLCAVAAKKPTAWHKEKPEDGGYQNYMEDKYRESDTRGHQVAQEWACGICQVRGGLCCVLGCSAALGCSRLLTCPFSASLSLSLRICLSFSPLFSLSLPLSLPLSASLSLSLPLSASLCLSLSLSL